MEDDDFKKISIDIMHDIYRLKDYKFDYTKYTTVRSLPWSNNTSYNNVLDESLIL